MPNIHNKRRLSNPFLPLQKVVTITDDRRQLDMVDMHDTRDPEQDLHPIIGFGRNYNWYVVEVKYREVIHKFWRDRTRKGIWLPIKVKDERVMRDLMRSRLIFCGKESIYNCIQVQVDNEKYEKNCKAFKSEVTVNKNEVNIIEKGMINSSCMVVIFSLYGYEQLFYAYDGLS